MVAFPAFTDLLSFAVVLAVGLPLAYVVAKALRIHAERIDIADKKKEATLSLILFVLVFVIAFAILAVYDKVWVRYNLEEDLIYVLRDAIWVSAVLFPTFIIIKRTKQNLRSIGVSRKNLEKNLAFGLLVAVVFLGVLAVLAPSLGGTSFVGFSLPVIYSLISLIIISVAEELIFRGYIQTRLTAHAGATTGIASSAFLFALFNFPLGFFCYSGDVVSAFFYALWRFSMGLVFSYMFHKSQNIIPSSIFHTLLVWGALLMRLYF